MNYIQIGRSLDTLARTTDGYQDTPDDILKLILDYTGRIDYKPTFLYRVEIKFRYDSYRRLWTPNRDDFKWTINKKDKIGYAYFHYCSACCRFYAGHKTHLTRDKHIDNVRNGGDKGKDIKEGLKKKLIDKYKNNRFTRNVKMESYYMKDVWKL